MKMIGEQLYYTSCKIGYENLPGFQIKAISNGFKSDYIPIFKQLGLYKPPLNFITQPNKNELKLFPILFKYRKVKDCFLFINTTYVGKDFTGYRYGNYFLHGVLLDKLNTYPIDLYLSNIFIDNYTNDNIYLEPLIINIDEKNIKNKIKNAINRIDKKILKLMIRTLFILKEKDKKLLIKVNNNEEAIDYLIILQHILPLKFAKDFSFSSYQYDYKFLSDINVTIGKTEITLDSDDFIYTFFVFDLVNNKFSDINNNFIFYEKIVDYIEDINLLFNFNKFYSYFNTQELKYLNNILMLYLLILNKIELSNSELIKVLNIIQYIKDNKKDIIIDKLLPYVNKLKNLTIKEKISLLNFYLILYNQKKDNKYKEIIIKNLYDLYILTLNKEYSIEKYNLIYKKIIEHQELKNYLKKYLQQNLKNIYSVIKFMEKSEIYNLIKFILPLQDEDLYELTIEILKQNEKEFPFEIINISRDKNYYILLLYKYIKNKSLLINYLVIYLLKEDKKFFKFCKYLLKNNLSSFLELLFKKKLQNSNDKIKFYSEFTEKLSIEYSFLNIYWNELSNIEKRKQILIWFKLNKLENILQYINDEIAEFLNNNIYFTVEDYELENIIHTLHINIDQTNFANKIFLKSTLKNFNINDLDLIQKELNILYKINKKEVIEYLSVFYKELKGYDIQDLTFIFDKTLKEEIVLKVFKTILDNKVFSRIHIELLIFWLQTDNLNFKYKYLQKEILDIFIQKLKQYKKDDILKVKNIIKQTNTQNYNEHFETFFDELLFPNYKKFIKKTKNIISSLFKKEK